jgi:hypothetical protein
MTFRSTARSSLGDGKVIGPIAGDGRALASFLDGLQLVL